jgi:hypothetical protein
LEHKWHNMKYSLLLCILSGLFLSKLQAQCAFTPSVNGNLLICPNDSTVLSTQAYDAYQWFTRPFGAGGSPQPISGATGPSFSVAYQDTPLYVSVAGTREGCTERSAEVLVDGLLFLPLVVQTSGTFSIGPNGEALFCPGDTMYLIALQPYTLNHIWYDGDTAIPGATDDTLVVTRPGSYWLTASPGQCPALTAFLGVRIDVAWQSTCVSSTDEPEQSPWVVQPNPAGEWLEISTGTTMPTELHLLDLSGRTLHQQRFSGHTTVPLLGLPAGLYLLRLRSGSGPARTLKVMKW